MKAKLAVAVWVVLIVIGTWMGAQFDLPTIGLLFGLFMAHLSINAFIVSVPEVTGLITMDVFTGELYKYKQGLHFRFPWEETKKSIPLKIVTKEEEESYPSGNGPLILTKWSFQYRPHFDSLELYIRTDESEIVKGVMEIVGSILSINIGQLGAKECKKGQSGIQQQIKDALGLNGVTGTEDFKCLYGIEIIKFSLSDLDFEESYQKARANREVTEQVMEMAQDIANKMKGKMDEKENAVVTQEHVNAALALQGSVQTFNIGGKSSKGARVLAVAKTGEKH